MESKRENETKTYVRSTLYITKIDSENVFSIFRPFNVFQMSERYLILVLGLQNFVKI